MGQGLEGACSGLGYRGGLRSRGRGAWTLCSGHVEDHTRDMRGPGDMQRSPNYWAGTRDNQSQGDDIGQVSYHASTHPPHLHTSSPRAQATCTTMTASASPSPSRGPPGACPASAPASACRQGTPARVTAMAGLTLKVSRRRSRAEGGRCAVVEECGALLSKGVSDK